MSLTERKVPILPTINDVPSVSGQEHHPNSALLCASYNALIDNELSNFETNITLLSQLENILWQQGEIAWILFRVHKVGTGSLTGRFRTLKIEALPLLPEIINNNLNIAYTATNKFDLNLGSPLSRAAFLPSTNTYPSLIFRTTNL